MAVVERQDPRDALICSHAARQFARGLAAGARVGTSSLRRRAFLAHLRPDIMPLELRGNVPTRIEKLQQGDYDAIILASAGLGGSGSNSTSPPLAVEDFTPAVSQGAIGVCARGEMMPNAALAARAR